MCPLKKVISSSIQGRFILSSSRGGEAGERGHRRPFLLPWQPSQQRATLAAEATRAARRTPNQGLLRQAAFSLCKTFKVIALKIHLYIKYCVFPPHSTALFYCILQVKSQLQGIISPQRRLRTK